MSTTRSLGRTAHGAVALLLLSGAAHAQAVHPAPRDSAAHADSIGSLRAVTVTAAPIGQDRPSSVQRIDRAALRDVPAATPYEVLRQAAGLEVHQQGQGPGFASDAAVRGFSSDHSADLALWIDGVPINEPVNGHAEGYNDFSLLFPAGIADIDVLRGPTSALFGNFAMAGVVTVRTLERMRGTELTVSGGSYGRGEAMLLSGFDHGDRGSGVLGARFVREDGFRPNAGYDVGQLHARVVHDLRPGVRIDGGVELYAGGWASPGFLGAGDYARGAYDIVSNPTDGGFKRRAQERLSLRVVRGSMLWRSTVYATQGRWQLFLTIPPEGGRFEGTGSQTEEEDARLGLGATTAATWELPHGELTMGGETRWDRSGYDNFFTSSRVRDSVETRVTGTQASGALFVQSHTDVTRALRFDAGLRLDALRTRSAPVGDAATDASHGILSPKLGALWQLSRAVGVYGNVSRGFRSADGVISDPALAPVTAWAYEGGVKLERDALRFTAALFRMDVSNEQTINPATLETTDGGRSRRQGLELRAEVRAAAWATLGTTWTFNDARYRSLTAAPEDGSGPPEVLDGQRVFNTSKYVGAGALTLRLPHGGWRAQVGGNWVGPYSPFDAPGEVVGAYGLAHLLVAVPLRNGEVTLGVRNLLDRHYPEVVAGGLVSPGQPRTVSLSTRLALR